MNGKQGILALVLVIGCTAVRAQQPNQLQFKIDSTNRTLTVSAEERGAAADHERSFYRGGRGGDFAGAGEAICSGTDDGIAGPAAEGVLAGHLGIAAANPSGAAHLCFLPSGDHGAGFEHPVRGRCL